MKGVFTALVTPFDTKQRVDLSGLRQNIRHQIAEGVDGIAVLGTTGESPTLSQEEKRVIITTAIEEAKGKILIMVGTGSFATQQAIENTQLAENLGADAAMIVTPYYNKPTQEGIYLHFKAIAESVSLPIILYNIQGRTGQNIQTSTLQRLSDIPNIIGVKEASGSVIQMMEVIHAMAHCRPDFKILSGDDNLTLALMALGGHGVISVLSNLVPRLVKDLVTATETQNFSAAQQIHYQLFPLFKGIFLETNPIPIKAAMGLRGMPSGPCRLPLCPLQPENLHTLKKLLAEMI